MSTTRRDYFTGIALAEMLRNDALANASREEIADAAVKMADAVLSRLEMDVEVETVASPEPDADGWIQWNGGPCPIRDIQPGRAEAKFRCGKTSFLTASNYYWDDEVWSHDDYYLDIVAYRIHKP